MKQTAVEWLQYELASRGSRATNQHSDLLEKAKEMERQHIINACNQEECFGSFDFKGYDNISKGEEYYNINFKNPIARLSAKNTMNFIEKLLKEESELNEKTQKLHKFISSEDFKTISKHQQSLLKIQLSAMTTYSQCLNERFIDFNNETKED